jgi:hypothetical protein
MPAKQYSVEQIVAKLRGHAKLEGQGLTVPQACRRIGDLGPDLLPLAPIARRILG